LHAEDAASTVGTRAVNIQLQAVAVRRGQRLIFRDLSMTIASGEAIILSGPNGAGKSTLLRVLAGLIRPVAGTVLWQGHDIFDDLAEHGPRAAYVGHQDAIKLGLTVTENLSFAAAIARRPIGPALAAMNLTALADLRARMLSAGQKRRVALARLALSNAPLWLLDEPTLGLDTASIARFGAMLAAHRAAGGMVVAATHVPLPLADVSEVRLG